MTNQPADTAFDQRDYTAAAKLYGPRAPADLHATYRLGLCHFRLKDFAAALRAFRSAIDYHPEDARSWYYLGVSAERTGDTAAAIPAYRMALRFDPTLSQAREKLMALDPDAALPGDNLAQSTSGTAQISGDTKNTAEDDTGDPGELIYSSRRRIISFEWHIIFFVLFPFLMVNFFQYPWHLFFVNSHFFGFDQLRGSDVDIAAFVILAAVLLIIPLDALLRSRTTQYRLYERRLDIHKGILNQSIRSIWLFKMIDLTMKRSPISHLTKNASIDIDSEIGKFRITGLVPPKGESAVTFTHNVFDQIRTAVRGQRGTIKKMWA